MCTFADSHRDKRWNIVHMIHFGYSRGLITGRVCKFADSRRDKNNNNNKTKQTNNNNKTEHCR